ncbi:YjbF family lipoprotein [Pseudoroseicyclus sp. CXY001]|uniref:YjbF family lipoprotein n=1 Tax=Pseudoroseicyclus sp. CXY001 TaxID=3242492 RepID=UPI0035714A71
MTRGLRTCGAALALALACSACGVLPTGSGTPEIAPPSVGLTAGQLGLPVLNLSLLETGTAGTMALVASRDGYDTYMSSDDISLTLRAGMLIATRGFGGDLASTDASATAAALATGSAGPVERFHGFYTRGEEVALTAFVCTLTWNGAEALQRPGGPVTAQRVTEFCRSPSASFANTFWVDGSGRIVQSVQWAGERIGLVALIP